MQQAPCVPAVSPACNVSGQATWASTTTVQGQFTNTPAPVSGGTIAGIVIGVLIFLAALVVGIVVLKRMGYIGASAAAGASSTPYKAF